MFRGNSGFKVEFGRGADSPYVMKSSPDYGSIQRLTRQMQKQVQQRQEMRLPANVRIPYAEQRAHDTWAISRIHGQNMFELTGAQRGPAFAQVLALVGRYVVQSSLVTMLPKAWKDKCAEIAANCTKNHRKLDRALAAEAQHLVEKIGDRLFAKKSRMLLGPCHGDLTFSNMLWDGEGYLWVFDFLDCFVESPIMDLVKLRQDTLYHWSSQRLPEADAKPFAHWHAELDKELMGYVRQRSWARDWFPEISALNLARVFQYSTDEAELRKLVNFVKAELCLTF